LVILALILLGLALSLAKTANVLAGAFCMATEWQRFS
jgi:hypothetical protein